LQTPELEITGSLVPGLTFLVSSHNIKIAWGMISLHANAGDYWTEKLSPNGKHVKIKGPQEPLLVREERSKVRWSGHSSCVKTLMGQLSINFFSRPILRIF
jgi:acyl-homoserine lactone acylase PvdQ